MKACAIAGFGQPLALVDLPAPTPAAGQLLLRVQAAGASMLDRLMVAGRLAGLMPHRFPLVPGWDCAGTVVAVGDGVDPELVGEQRMALALAAVAQHGCWAEVVAVAAEQTAPVPARWSVAEAASLPLAGLAAFQALFGPMGLRAGDTLLVLGAAGGVGSYAVQLAALAGAAVVAVDEPAHLGYLEGLGADTVLDFADFDSRLATDCAFGPDACLDLMGGMLQGRALAAIKDGGILVSLVDPPDEEQAWGLGKRIAFNFVQANGAHLRQLAEWAATGQLRPPHLHRHALAEAPALISRPAPGWGKTVVVP